jgi:hypothetical protein
MGVLQLLDELPDAIARPPAALWLIMARSLGEQGGAGRTALAWRWALTGACPAPVTLATAPGAPPGRAELLDEAGAPAELARPGAYPGGQVMQARVVLEWLAGTADALPLRSPADGEPDRTEGAAFARGPAQVAAAHSWALLARHRYSRPDGFASGGGRQAFAWALGTLDLLAWAGGEAAGDRPAGAGPPTLGQVALEVGRGMTGVRLAREARDLARARRVEAVMETFLWLAGWSPQPPVDRHGHGTFEDCPQRTVPCACDAAGRCLAAGCAACVQARCVHGFTRDELSSPLTG